MMMMMMMMQSNFIVFGGLTSHWFDCWRYCCCVVIWRREASFLFNSSSSCVLLRTAPPTVRSVVAFLCFHSPEPEGARLDHLSSSFLPFLRFFLLLSYLVSEEKVLKLALNVFLLTCFACVLDVEMRSTSRWVCLHFWSLFFFILYCYYYGLLLFYFAQCWKTWPVTHFCPGISLFFPIFFHLYSVLCPVTMKVSRLCFLYTFLVVMMRRGISLHAIPCWFAFCLLHDVVNVKHGYLFKEIIIDYFHDTDM